MTPSIRGGAAASIPRGAWWLVLSAVFACWTSAAVGNETDQFLLPPADEWADVGEFMSGVHYMVVQDAMTYVNGQIERAMDISDPLLRERAMDRWQRPEALADAVRKLWGAGFWEMLHAERFFNSAKMQQQFPGKIVAYETRDWLYSYVHLPIDPRNIPLLLPSSTIKVFDVYVGVDKLGHMHDLGHIYYKDYIWGIANGYSPEEALSTVIQRYGRGLISESKLIGWWATGVCSNADTASNYIGMKFYMNLFEETRVQTEMRPPMLVREGEFWRFADHVEPETMLRPFITDHLNEALNPSLHDWGSRASVRGRLMQIADRIVMTYADEDGNARPPKWFEDKARDLITYYGEDYGHRGSRDQLINIADVHPDTPREPRGWGVGM